jgi:Mrp family chromosome partitioning ATPase
VLSVTDAAALAAQADAVLMVAAAGRTTAEEVLRARDTLLGAGANIAGVVLSGSEDSLTMYYGKYRRESVNGEGRESVPGYQQDYRPARAK